MPEPCITHSTPCLALRWAIRGRISLPQVVELGRHRAPRGSRRHDDHHLASGHHSDCIEDTWTQVMFLSAKRCNVILQVCCAICRNSRAFLYLCGKSEHEGLFRGGGQNTGVILIYHIFTDFPCGLPGVADPNLGLHYGFFQVCFT